jgi:hypothetical protein
MLWLMGRGCRPSTSATSGARGRGEQHHRRDVLIRRLDLPVGEQRSLDELCAVIAVRSAWLDPEAVPSLRLIDALWHGDFDDLNRQSVRLRQILGRRGLGHEATRIAAGLLLHRAQHVLAPVYGVAARRFRDILHARSGDAKAAHRFPWHLLDG